MPNFDSSTWANFKAELMSVLDWLIYSFNLIFDQFRAHPMLYTFLFFPIFAFVAFVILDFLLNIVHVQSLFESTDIHTDNSLFKSSSGRGGIRSSERAVNLAGSIKEGKTAAGSAVKLSAAASVKSGSSLGAAVSFGSHKVDSNGSMHKVDSASARSAGSAGGHSSASGSGSIHAAGGNETHAANELIKKGIKVYKDSKARKQQDEDMYNKIAAEQEALQAQHQAEYDRAYNMQTDLYYSKDPDGNPVTERQETNKRTGEITGKRVTVRHTADSDEDDN